MAYTFPMNGGDGAYSYTKNSQFQKEENDSVKGMLQEAVIENLDIAEILKSISNTVSITDMGCSVGPNTFFTVQDLIEAVVNKCSLQGLDSKNLEFQVYFNDHSANDFNTLFASLPAHRQYHAAGVGGSFHGRLFPRASITVAHSSHALHWLSKQPPQLGLVPNEGRIHYAGAPDDVARAFSDQFERDFGVFMSARAEEIVSGGLLFVIMPGLSDGISHSDLPMNILFSFLGDNLMDLADEGVVDRAKIDEFNLPIYTPTAGEMRKVIERNGCFSIQKMELMKPRSQAEGKIDAMGLILSMRAGMEGIFTAHFGSFVVEKMFGKFYEKAQEISERFEAAHMVTQFFVVLKRK